MMSYFQYYALNFVGKSSGFSFAVLFIFRIIIADQLTRVAIICIKWEV